MNKNGITTSVVRGVNNVVDDNDACFIAVASCTVVGGTSVYDIIARHDAEEVGILDAIEQLWGLIG